MSPQDSLQVEVVESDVYVSSVKYRPAQFLVSSAIGRINNHFLLAIRPAFYFSYLLTMLSDFLQGLNIFSSAYKGKGFLLMLTVG